MISGVTESFGWVLNASIRLNSRAPSMAELHNAAKKAIPSCSTLLVLLAFLGIAVLTSGCAALPFAALAGTPNPSALEIHNNTEVRLQNKNFMVIKTNVIGQSSGFSLLGIVTIVPAKFTTAMGRLYGQAEMQPGRPQTLVNLIMEKNGMYFILFSIPRTSIRADVIEFLPGITNDIPPLTPRAKDPPKPDNNSSSPN